MEFFLMFFSGVGHVAAGMRMRGISTLEIDIKHGSHFDLTDARIQRKVLKLARRHRICGACIGMPCTSFSLARNRTRVIRTCEFPWGLGGRELWSKNDVKSLELGNELASFTIKLIKILHRRGIPWILENPFTSNAWHLPEILQLMTSPRVQYQRVDMCGYGTRWKKPTGLLCGNCNSTILQQQLSRVCNGKRGLCGHTCRRHVILSGSAPAGGMPWTKVAQAYPRRFADAVCCAITSC